MIMPVVLVLLSCYYQAAPILARYGLTTKILDMPLLMYREYFEQPLKVKGLALLLGVLSGAFRTGSYVDTKVWKCLAVLGGGVGLTLLCPENGMLYSLTSLTGIITTIVGADLTFRSIFASDGEEPDEDEGFKQNERKIETDDSFNIPTLYMYKGMMRHGWVNVINPFRATSVLGSPGSGKSFAVYNPIIEQAIRKGYTMFLYDYKFPDLTTRVLTEIAYQARHEGLWQGKTRKGKPIMPKKPHLYIINFDDPTRSNRCNPIRHTYITDPADSTEIADLVFLNINKGSDPKGFDFFNESAKVYLDAIIYWLANYDPDALYEDPDDPQKVTGSRTNYVNKGRYCTFPHVIEVMAYNYKKTFQILQFTRGLEAKISPFASALETGAMEQLMGQVASAQIPLGKFVSPALYWVMTGDDMTLDINNPDEPKIICMGNNPDRQSIYGTTLALYTGRMFKLINHKGKLKSVVLLDELPTIFIKGLDNLIATARSNKVAIVIGAQDKSQMRRDYGDKEAEVIMTTVGNLFSGAVEGRTAKDIAETFGKQFRRRVSQSLGDDSDSRSISYQQEEILPASKIVDMSQGTFCGWVKDNYGLFLKRKKFHGEIVVDLERNDRLEAEAQEVPVITDMFRGSAPAPTGKDVERISLTHPELAGNEKKINELFVREKIQEEVLKNFNAVKADVRALIEKEFERTAPFAEAYRAENGVEEG